MAYVVVYRADNLAHSSSDHALARIQMPCRYPKQTIFEPGVEPLAQKQPPADKHHSRSHVSMHFVASMRITHPSTTGDLKISSSTCPPTTSRTQRCTSVGDAPLCRDGESSVDSSGLLADYFSLMSLSHSRTLPKILSRRRAASAHSIKLCSCIAETQRPAAKITIVRVVGQCRDRP